MLDRLVLLRLVPLLSSLPPQELQAVAALLVERRFAAGEEILGEGEVPHSLGIVRSGRLKIIKQSLGGKDTTVAVLKPGEIFGEVSLFSGSPYAATVVPITPCSVLLMRREDVVELVRRHPQLAMRIIGALSRRLRYTQEMMQLIATERVETRIAHLLVWLAAEMGVECDGTTLINMPLTRREMAAMAGTTVETAIRVLSRFAKEGYLSSVPGLRYPTGCDECYADTFCRRCHKTLILRLADLRALVDGAPFPSEKTRTNMTRVISVPPQALYNQYGRGSVKARG